ncbi:unnamed protein product [Lactuca saligna]|uniref:Defective in cullin neddylation protein n=1 Tax=Lactuca saligna TaxID=75948 RepID=A0AA35ZMD0_LACSI|nr:unnamed protein product [Lactuca saligna]
MDLFRSASGKAASKELERIDQLYYSYANESSGMIDPEGIEYLCSDLKVEHTDVCILMLAWKMQDEKQGYFTLLLEIKFKEEHINAALPKDEQDNLRVPMLLIAILATVVGNQIQGRTHKWCIAKG